ncbi:MAG: hypothetical protein J0H65_16680 [Rhizobiales bacterium]|nr:hypothetical protein [Hyphomicrobiales bacterium]
MTDTHGATHDVAERGWWKPLLLGLLACLMILFGLSLGRDSSVLPSALVGKPAPSFVLRVGAARRG